jgi:uncharacterized OB-fold protein
MSAPERSRPDAVNVETANDWAANLKSGSILPPRCDQCGHIIWHPESVSAGLGRDCRRALRRAATEVAA